MIERRLTHRLTKYWELIRKDQPLPRFEKFNSAAVDDVFATCMILKVNNLPNDKLSYTFYQMGKKLRDLYNEDLTGNTLNPSQRMFKGATVIKRADEMAKTLEPIYDGGQFINSDNKVIKFRSCLLPFGFDGHMTHMLAGLSWREF
ncbi:MAG: PAS domain-containing protein [Rickettsiales bacterium]|nr:PAS domain-containing protein [Rickettsiales bacterium]